MYVLFRSFDTAPRLIDRSARVDPKEFPLCCDCPAPWACLLILRVFTLCLAACFSVLAIIISQVAFGSFFSSFFPFLLLHCFPLTLWRVEVSTPHPPLPDFRFPTRNPRIYPLSIRVQLPLPRSCFCLLMIERFRRNK